MIGVAYTGKCGECGHVQSAHRHSIGSCLNRSCQCKGYAPVIDIEAHNSADGRPAMELYKFQKDYLKGLPAKYLFAAETGTGKTVMALSHYDAHRYPEPLLILAPAAKVGTGDWEREINAYFAGRILPEFEIYSYEKFSRNTSAKQYHETGSRGIWHDWREKYPRGFAMIADEVHKAKNPQSGMGKITWEVSKTASTTSFFSVEQGYQWLDRRVAVDASRQ